MTDQTAADPRRDAPAQQRHHVVVGISRTPSGRAALWHAAGIAARTHASLLLVRVLRDADHLHSRCVAKDKPDTLERWSNQCALSDAGDLVRAEFPRVTCASELARGDLLLELLRTAHGQSVLVLGTGSTPESCASMSVWLESHARCPVLLVGEDGKTRPLNTNAARANEA